MSFATAIGAVGTGLQIFGQLRAGQQAKGIHDYNAAINRQKADLIEQQGRIQIAKQRRQKKSLLAQEEGLRAKSGVDARGSYSVFQSLARNSAELEHDVLLTDFNTRIAMLNAEMQAELDVFRGKEAVRASRVSAGTTLLTQLSSFTQSGNLGNISHRMTNPLQGPLQEDGSF
jgi:hypothetical protein